MTKSPLEGGGRVDWKLERERVDLARVATELLGEPPGRRGERGRRLWWNCPIHDDPNPSFYVDPGKATWGCYGCGERGDAAALVMRLERLTFPQAMARLLGEGGGPVRSSYRPPPRPPAPPPGPSGLPAPAALALVVESEARLWSAAGADALAYLLGERRLSEATIRGARLGWTPGVDLPARDDKTFRARGVVIPWIDGDRLALARIRQPGDARPKYAEAYRDRPGVLLGTPVAAGLPLVLAEGEFDALLLGQELLGLAVVATLGPASVRPERATLVRFLGQFPWYVATDDDDAGDRAAKAWIAASGTARRVKPPAWANDWTELASTGVDLRRWWADRLAGVESPELFTRAELDAQRWGDADATPGVDVPADCWRWRVANWPIDRWLAWHRRAGELVRPGDDAGAIRAAQRRAYDELADENPPRGAIAAADAPGTYPKLPTNRGGPGDAEGPIDTNSQPR